MLDALRELLERTAPGAEVDLIAVGPGRGVLAAWRLRRQGRVVRARLVAVPGLRAPRRFVGADRDVLSALLFTGDDRRLARALVRRLPGAALATRLASGVLVVTGADDDNAGDLGRLVSGAVVGRLAVLPSRDHAGVIALWAGRGADPIAYVKVGDVGAESRLLRRLGPGAAAAGARVPEVLHADDRVLANTALDGPVAAGELRRTPARLGAVVDAVVDWLGAWHAAEASPRALSAADVERHLLAPARRLEGHLDRGYLAWLERAAGALRGRDVAMAPAHRDLTMSNVRLGRGRIGVIDWEAATEQTLPLVDAPYALVDAVAACATPVDRLAAFERCFGTPGSAEAGLARAALERLRARGCHDPAVLTCAFHACWLSHAGNDLLRDGPTGTFVRIAQRIAADPDRYDGFAGAA
jgi:hypothetical protein